MVEEEVDIAKVVVPTVPDQEVSLSDEYERVRGGLEQMRAKFVAADDQLLAGRIRVGGKHEASGVDYHPDGLEPWVLEGESAPLDLEGLLAVHYDRRYDIGAYSGLRRFMITTGGHLRVTQFEPDSEARDGYTWTRSARATPDQLNEALEGLVAQHVALIADRQAHSVVGVNVPSVG